MEPTTRKTDRPTDGPPASQPASQPATATESAQPAKQDKSYIESPSVQRRAHHAREIEHAVAHAEGLGWRVDPEAEGYEDRLFEAGCDDATFSFQKGVIIAEFHRKAVTFSAAIASAYEAMLSVGAKVERIEPDHLVSLSEIAERSGLTRQAISLYTRAERGENFPGHSDHPEPVEGQGHETSFVGLA